MGGCGVCSAVFRGFWWWCGVCLWWDGFGGVSVCGGTYYLPLSVRYALWCRFLFLGVENQPLGVVFGVAVWVRARFGGLVALLEVSLVTVCRWFAVGLLLIPAYVALLVLVYLRSLPGITKQLVYHLFSVV